MKNLSKEEIIKYIKNKKLEFAWINTYSDLLLKKMEENDDIEAYFEDLIEGKFFDEDREISVIVEDDKFLIVEFKDIYNNEYIIEEQNISNHKSPLSNEKSEEKFDRLVIRHYLNYDEEGQAYIAYTKLCNVKEGVYCGK